MILTNWSGCRNIAEQLVEKGLASVVRHKRDDEDRSSDYDKLMTAEQALVLILFLLWSPIEMIWSIRAVADTRGIHSGKEIPPSKQPLNISEVSPSFIKGWVQPLTCLTDKYPSRSIFKRFQAAGKNSCSCGLRSRRITIQVRCRIEYSSLHEPNYLIIESSCLKTTKPLH